MGASRHLQIEKQIVTIHLTPSLTSGQVAALMSVAPRTVSKMMERGELVGYRIPGSEDRRFYLDTVLGLMRDCGMRIDPQLDDTPDVICYGCSVDLPQVVGYTTPLELGLYLGKTFRLRIAFVGDSNGIIEMYKVIDSIKAYQPNATIVALYSSDKAGSMGSHDNADMRFLLPTDVDKMLEKVQKFAPKYRKSSKGVPLTNRRKHANSETERSNLS